MGRSDEQAVSVSSEVRHIPLADALRFWLKLGFISFGGPAGQIAIMHEHVVEREKWISDKRFLHALNYCMLLPGPEAQQLATYLGWLMHGTVGGLAAGLLFVLPSMFILLALSVVYVTFGALPVVAAVFAGLKPAVVAIIFIAMIKIGKRSLSGTYHYLVATASFMLIFFFNVPFPLIILLAALLPIVQMLFLRDQDSAGPFNGAKDEESDSDRHIINSGSILPHTAYSHKKLMLQTGVAAVLWLLPLGLLMYFSDPEFWGQLVGFFSKAAVVTFGGAYSVLPYVAQVSVEQFNWLTGPEMIDGLALGETTPGPLIMVLTFVGFMAGHGHFGGSVLMGAIGLTITTWYTFLPCFYFILAGAPFVERTFRNESLKRILAVVTAAVVGVVLNLAVYLSEALFLPGWPDVIRPDYMAIGWAVVSFVAMQRFSVSMLTWIGVSALFGLTRFLLGL